MGSQLPDGLPAPADGSLPTSAFESQNARTWHAYVHVPFCRVRCGYCDFNTYTSSELDGYHPSQFLRHLQSEIAIANSVVGLAGERKLASVFFGGGTPSQLPAEQLTLALQSLRDVWGLADSAEVTTEANPDNVNEDYLKVLRSGGFTRLSLGMQSAVPSVLKTLDRTHNPENVSSAVRAAKTVGLQTSVDLIYGAPGESMDDWRRTVDTVLELNTDHISAYALIVEQGTKLARDISAGRLSEPDEDLEAEKYEYADLAFSQAGFSWYELSNWSKLPSTRSTHNLAYWSGADWWGFGPGAHSHFGGVRWWNVKHPTTYAAKLKAGESPAAGREFIDKSTSLVERVMLEIRLAEGVPIAVVKELNANASSVVAKAIAEGLIDPARALQGQIVLTLKGRLLADALVRDFIG